MLCRWLGTRYNRWIFGDSVCHGLVCVGLCPRCSGSALTPPVYTMILTQPVTAVLWCCNRHPGRLFASQGLWEDASRDLSAGLRGDPNDVRCAQTFSEGYNLHARVRAIGDTNQCRASDTTFSSVGFQRQQARHRISLILNSLSHQHTCPNATISKFGYFPTLGAYLEMSLAPSGSPLARVVSVVLGGCIFPAGNASTPDQLEGYRLRGNALIHVSEINLSRLAGLCCAPVLGFYSSCGAAHLAFAAFRKTTRTPRAEILVCLIVKNPLGLVSSIFTICYL